MILKPYSLDWTYSRGENNKFAGIIRPDQNGLFKGTLVDRARSKPNQQIKGIVREGSAGVLMVLTHSTDPAKIIYALRRDQNERPVEGSYAGWYINAFSSSQQGREKIIPALAELIFELIPQDGPFQMADAVSAVQLRAGVRSDVPRTDSYDSSANKK